MMRVLCQIISFISLFVVLLFCSSCGRTKTIPDDELEIIFKEFYLANAYYTVYKVNTDTVDIYKPILAKYGYNSDDFKATLLGFTKRKSAKLSLVIQDVIRQIDDEYNWYGFRVAVLDTVGNRSKRQLQQILIENRRIEVNRIKDTSKLIIELDVLPGSYLVSYISDVDSLEKNNSLKGSLVVLDSSGKKINSRSNWFGVKKRKHYSTEIEVDSNITKLVLNLGSYGEKMKKPSLVIDSLSVVYFLPTKQAVDSIGKMLIDYKLLIDGKEWPRVAQDSISLYLSPPRIDSLGGDKPE